MKRGLAIFGAIVLLLVTLVSLLSFFLPAPWMAALPVGVALAVVLCTLIGAVEGTVTGLRDWLRSRRSRPGA